MSRKRGKHKKGAVEAIPAEVLAEGSGPVDVAAHVVTTVEDVATTDDIATVEDVITPDDVVAAEDAPSTESEPVPMPAPAPRSRKKKAKRGAKAAAAAAAADPAEDDGELIADVPVREPDPNELNNAELADLIEAGAAVGAEPDSEARDGVAVTAFASDDEPDDDESGDRDVDAESLEADSDGGGDDGDDGDLGDREGGGEDGEGGGEDGEGGEIDDESVVVFPTSAGSMDSVQLKHLVESLVFASDKPLTVQRLRQLTRVGDTRRLQLALTELEVDYRERGVVLQQVSGGYQFRTRTQFSAWVQQLIAGRPVRLSRAQLETLAIIAYRQPITRPEIDDIRGVDSTATVKLLLDRMLIRSLGKREEVGRPTLYGTSKEFLDFFSLGDLRELPTLREYSELTAESRKVMSDRLGIPADEDGSGGKGGGSGSGGAGGAGGAGPANHADSDGAGPAASAGGAAPDGAEPAQAADAMASYFAAADALDRSEATELDDAEPDASSSDDSDGISADLLAGDDSEDLPAEVLASDLLAGDDSDPAAADAVESPVATAAAEHAAEHAAEYADITHAVDLAPGESDAAVHASAEGTVEAETAAAADAGGAEGAHGQVAGDSWPLGSQPVAVVAPMDVRPVERPAMDEQALDATSLDAERVESAAAPHVDPAAE